MNFQQTSHSTIVNTVYHNISKQIQGKIFLSNQVVTSNDKNLIFTIQKASSKQNNESRGKLGIAVSDVLLTHVQ